jgi:hypothetical protein
VLGLGPRELRVALPAGASAIDCLRACRTIAASIPDAQIATLAGVGHNVPAAKRLLLRERDNGGYAQGVVPPVADQRSAPLEAGGLPLVCGGPFRRPVRPRRFRSGPL